MRLSCGTLNNWSALAKLFKNYSTAIQITALTLCASKAGSIWAQPRKISKWNLCNSSKLPLMLANKTTRSASKLCSAKSRSSRKLRSTMRPFKFCPKPALFSPISDRQSSKKQRSISPTTSGTRPVTPSKQFWPRINKTLKLWGSTSSTWCREKATGNLWRKRWTNYWVRCAHQKARMPISTTIFLDFSPATVVATRWCSTKPFRSWIKQLCLALKTLSTTMRSATRNVFSVTTKVLTIFSKKPLNSMTHIFHPSTAWSSAASSRTMSKMLFTSSISLQNLSVNIMRTKKLQSTAS